MVKNMAASPKWLFHVVTWIEDDQYTLIEQSGHWILLTAIFYCFSYNCHINDICIQFRYIIMYDVTVKWTAI